MTPTNLITNVGIVNLSTVFCMDSISEFKNVLLLEASFFFWWVVGTEEVYNGTWQRRCLTLCIHTRLASFAVVSCLLK